VETQIVAEELQEQRVRVEQRVAQAVGAQFPVQPSQAQMASRPPSPVMLASSAAVAVVAVGPAMEQD
jgi:hypothetical protein